MAAQMLAMLALAALGVATPAGLLLERYSNTQALGAPESTSTVDGADVRLEQANGALSLRLQGTWTPAVSADYVLHCGCAASDHLFLWIDDHMMCDTQSWTGWQGPTRGPAAVPLKAGKAVYFRAHLHRAQGRPQLPVTMNLTLNMTGELQPIPASELSPAVPALQARRMTLQRGLLSGWNSWWSTIGAKPGYRGGMLAVALLPESFALTMVLCQLSTATCLSESTVAGTLTGPHRVRPGIKALDASYAELWAPAPGGLNVSLRWSASTHNGGDDLAVLVTPLPNSTQRGLNLSDWALAVTGRFICWNGEQGLCSAGPVSAKGAAVTGQGAGLRTITAVGSGSRIAAPGLNVSMDQQTHPAAIFSLAQPVSVCASTTTSDLSPSCSVAEVTASLAARRAAELATYSQHGPELAEAMEAMQSVLMW